MSLNEISTDGRNPFQSTHRRCVTSLRFTRREVAQEFGERVLARPEEDRVRMRCSFVRQRRDVQAPENNVGPAPAIVVRNLISAVGVCNVDLNNNQIRSILQVELLDVLVLQRDLDVGIEVRSECCQTKRRKQRVLDRPPIGARSFRQRRKNQLDALD